MHRLHRKNIHCTCQATHRASGQLESDGSDCEARPAVDLSVASILYAGAALMVPTWRSATSCHSLKSSFPAHDWTQVMLHCRRRCRAPRLYDSVHDARSCKYALGRPGWSSEDSSRPESGVHTGDSSTQGLISGGDVTTGSYASLTSRTSNTGRRRICMAILYSVALTAGSLNTKTQSGSASACLPLPWLPRYILHIFTPLSRRLSCPLLHIAVTLA
ncbi:hypothetical protein GY45DRAFT_198928 [Cubamyces sp. BRFM 1775]|nr:hypothetical protein GY45DRAFT_198928 [Cubamyces sp. BRFM 1775]